MRAPSLFALFVVSGCYLSHGPEHGSGAAPPACVFSFDYGPLATRVECRIEIASRSGCLDAARCICAARIANGAADDLDACVVGETRPRALITFSDFCTDLPPARMNMTDALEGYFRGSESNVISTECAAIPALFGG